MTSQQRKALSVVGVVAALAVVGGGIAAATLTWGGPDGGDAPATGRVPQSLISADTRMGAVELRARDLPAMTEYYGPLGVGLDILERSDDAVSLGDDGEEIVRLVAAEGAPSAQGDAGLFHTAILFDDAPALAQALVTLAGRYANLYGGSADHAVSRAFYFADPEGNGVELYVDTPRDSWVWQDGEVRMGSAPLDIEGFVAEHLGDAADGGVAVGHVHLKVGDLEQAEAFYADTLGFAVTARADGAIFLAAGGYHHHLAANTWASAGAGPRPETLGLASLEVVVPSSVELDAVEARLADASLPSTRTADGLETTDPWGTVVELRVGEPGR